ncbi:hypothetical protein Ancab_013114 [Ancistrocladus abbreviatus]
MIRILVNGKEFLVRVNEEISRESLYFPGEDSRPDRQHRAEAPFESDKYDDPQSSRKTSSEGLKYCGDGKSQHEHGSPSSEGLLYCGNGKSQQAHGSPSTGKVTGGRKRDLAHSKRHNQAPHCTMLTSLTLETHLQCLVEREVEKSRRGGINGEGNWSGDETGQLEGDKQGRVDAPLKQTGGPPDVLGEKVGRSVSPEHTSCTVLIGPSLLGPPNGDPDKAEFGDGPELVTGAGLTLTTGSSKEKVKWLKGLVKKFKQLKQVSLVEQDERDGNGEVNEGDGDGDEDWGKNLGDEVVDDCLEDEEEETRISKRKRGENAGSRK